MASLDYPFDFQFFCFFFFPFYVLCFWKKKPFIFSRFVCFCFFRVARQRKDGDTFVDNKGNILRISGSSIARLRLDMKEQRENFVFLKWKKILVVLLYLIFFVDLTFLFLLPFPREWDDDKVSAHRVHSQTDDRPAFIDLLYSVLLLRSHSKYPLCIFSLVSFMFVFFFYPSLYPFWCFDAHTNSGVWPWTDKQSLSSLFGLDPDGTYLAYTLTVRAAPLLFPPSPIGFTTHTLEAWKKRTDWLLGTQVKRTPVFSW